MILDIVLIVLLICMIIYGYIKGFIKIVAKLVSVIIAIVLAYLLAGIVGEWISNTNLGINIQTEIENRVTNKLINSEKDTTITIIEQNMEIQNQEVLVQKIIRYVFVGIGFVSVFVVARILLWMVQKILENVFELPVLRTFNKLGGVISASAIYVIEVYVVLAIIKSVSTLEFMNDVVATINSTVITKVLYDYNIVANIILSKIF